MIGIIAEFHPTAGWYDGGPKVEAQNWAIWLWSYREHRGGLPLPGRRYEGVTVGA